MDIFHIESNFDLITDHHTRAGVNRATYTDPLRDVQGRKISFPSIRSHHFALDQRRLMPAASTRL
jgi:hypothetical protein